MFTVTLTLTLALMLTPVLTLTGMEIAYLVYVVLSHLSRFICISTADDQLDNIESQYFPMIIIWKNLYMWCKHHHLPQHD